MSVTWQSPTPPPDTARAPGHWRRVLWRGGRIVLVSDPAGIAAAGDGTFRAITMPVTDPLLAPILYAVPAQLIAYHTAIAKGTDVDQPRNLAKSVTVE